MNNRHLPRTLLAILLIIAAAALWLTRDQRQINGNLNRLRKLVSKSQEEKAIGGLIRAKEISSCFATPVNVALGAPWPDFTDRDTLAATVHHGRSMAQTIQVTIRNRTLNFGPDRQSATMDLAAEAVVTASSETIRDVREYRLRWVKDQGKWLISRVEFKETIRRPGGLGGADF